MTTLKKYWHIYQINWQASIAYRAELVVWGVIEAMPLISLFILWYAVYQHGDSLTGYSYQDLVAYYLLGFMIARMTNTNVEVNYIDQVRSGEISKFLLKPISFKKLLVIEELSWRSLNFLIIVLPLIILITIFSNQSLLNIPLSRLPILILFICIAFIINILISLIVLACSFFIDQGSTLSHFKWMLEGIFSGALLPLSVYPENLQKIARILPFQFRFAVPVEFALGSLNGPELISSIAIALGWIITLYITVKISWKYALRRFTAVGN